MPQRGIVTFRLPPGTQSHVKRPTSYVVSNKVYGSTIMGDDILNAYLDMLPMPRARKKERKKKKTW